MYDDFDCLNCGKVIIFTDARPFCTPQCEDQFNETHPDNLGTCQGCGVYGELGTFHVRNGMECGQCL